MEEWHKLTKGVLFITNLGNSPQVEVEGQAVNLGSYAVWAPLKENERSHQVIEVSENLEELMAKYNVPLNLIFNLVTDNEHA